MIVDIRKPLKEILPHLIKAREDNLNEADTVQRIIRVFEMVLGWDPLSEITGEKKVKDKYVDIALKLDGRIRFLVEAKSAGTDLRDRHMDQAKHYAAEDNIPWVVLTNSVTWILYHVTFEDGVDYVTVFEVDLSREPIDKAAEQLALLHRKTIQTGELDEYWSKRAALSPESISYALFAEDVLKLIRREIRKREELLIDEEDLAEAIHNMMSQDARDRMGPLKIRWNRKQRLKPSTKAEAVSQLPTNSASSEAPTEQEGCS